MSAILKFDFQKREQLRFSEVNYLNYTKRPNFACGNYIFPKTSTHKIIFTQLGRVNWKWLKVVLFFHKIVFAVKNTLTQHFG